MPTEHRTGTPAVTRPTRGGRPKTEHRRRAGGPVEERTDEAARRSGSIVGRSRPGNLFGALALGGALVVAGCVGEAGSREWPPSSPDAGAHPTSDAGSSLDGGDAGVPDAGPVDAGADVKPPHVLYPGDPACSGGCEKPLRHPDILIPARNGQPWGDTYQLGPDGQHHLAGYSSGRIALLRRLALRDDGDWAILLDPSWEDGARDFLQDGRPVTGPSLVRAWLLRSPGRRFLILYSTLSTGWSGYVALQAEPSLAGRVKVCTVDVGHLSVPAAAGPAVILDPEGYQGSCR